jgi:hypothetical protein
MNDPQDKGTTPDSALAIKTERAFTAEDLAFINRMTTTGQVLPSVAHELNNSLQIIAGMVEILGLRGQLPDDTADKVQKIGVQATRAAGMLRDLVSFARRDASLRKIDLHSAVERATGLRRYYLSRGRVTVHVNARQDEGSLVAKADSQAVVQVFVNLMLNAEESVAGGELREVRRGWGWPWPVCSSSRTAACSTSRARCRRASAWRGQRATADAIARTGQDAAENSSPRLSRCSLSMRVVRLSCSRRAACRLFPPVFSRHRRMSSRSSCDTTDVKLIPSSGMATVGRSSDEAGCSTSSGIARAGISRS